MIKESKEVLTLNDVTELTGMSKSYIYKLTHFCKIPHYKPFGKMLFFDRVEIIEWLKQNRVPTMRELEQKEFINPKNV